MFGGRLKLLKLLKALLHERGQTIWSIAMAVDVLDELAEVFGFHPIVDAISHISGKTHFEDIGRAE